MKEVKIIEIHSKYLFLREVTFQLYCNNPLNRLLQKTFYSAVCFLREKLFSKLLCDCRTTSSTCLSHHTTLHNSTSKGYKVNTWMFIKAFIFCRNKGMNKVWRQSIIVDCHTIIVIRVPSTDKLLVWRIDLRSKLIYRVRQFIHIRHVPYPSVPYRDEEYEDQAQDGKKWPPEEMYKVSSHNCENIMQR